MKIIKKNLPKVIMMLGGGILGLGIGAYLALNFDIGDLSFFKFLLVVLGVFIITLVTVFLHVIIHEGGHMIFGLLSGYKFVSFRVGSYTIIKQGGKLNHRKFSLAGTGGQCLMSPPPYNDGDFPYLLYNLGGSIANIIVALIFLVIKLLLKPEGIFDGFFIMMIAVGIGSAIMNGVPYKTDMVANDGYNAIHLGKDKDALRGFWVMLELNRLQAEGIRLRNINDDLIKIREGADLKNLFVSTLKVYEENRLMDLKDFKRAKDKIDFLLSDNCLVNGIYEMMLKLDRLYIDIIENKEKANLSILDDKVIDKFIKAMKGYPSVIRTLYSVSLIKNDLEQQRKLKDTMNKLHDTFPYPGDLKSEEELMDYAYDVINNKNL